MRRLANIGWVTNSLIVHWREAAGGCGEDAGSELDLVVGSGSDVGSLATLSAGLSRLGSTAMKAWQADDDSPKKIIVFDCLNQTLSKTR